MESNNQARWINTVLNQLSKTDDAKSRKAVENCGRECLKSGSKLERVMEIRDEIDDKSDRDRLFNKYKAEIYNNSPNLYRHNNDIYLEYKECGCRMVTQGGVKDPFLCNCTVGYTKQIFETLFKESVEVTLLKSILKGDGICRQRISIKAV